MWSQEKIDSYIGKKDGRLTVIAYEGAEPKPSNGSHSYFYTCKCDCGNIVHHKRIDDLKFNRDPSDNTIRSCGCAQKEKAAANLLKWAKEHPEEYEKNRSQLGVRKHQSDEEMRKYIGKRDGRLLIIDYEGPERRPHGGYRYFFTCRCDCGNIVHHRSLEGFNFNRDPSDTTIVSCGCAQKEKASLMVKERNFKHGYSGTRLENIYNDMRSRCYNPKDKNYPRYGNLKIGICPEWKERKNFYEWAITNGYRDDLTIDRIDNSKGYSPDNCRWVTQADQMRNVSTNIWISKIERYGDNPPVIKTLILTDWAKVLDLSIEALSIRLKKAIKRGTPINDIFIPKGVKPGEMFVIQIPLDIQSKMDASKFDISYHDPL